MNRDDRRVAAIEAYDVLDRDPRSDINAIVELAAKMCGTPMATINLITSTEQHQIATYGFDRSVCQRSDSMCAIVFEGPTPVVVADASRDHRFLDNPFVTGEIGDVRLYASHSLRTPTGVAIGTLCVFAEEPRELSPDQVRGLSLLAGRVVDSLELSLRSRELAASNQRLNSFASQVSHDLKTPLTTMGLSLDLIDEQLSPTLGLDDAKRMLDRAISAAARMAEYIDGHLEVASVQSGRRTRRVNLRLLVDEVLIDLDEAVHDVDVQVGQLPVVSGDPVLLRSVVLNLVHNAAKFRVPERSPRILIDSIRTDRLGWRIEVSDNGSGVDEVDRRRVFELGERAHDQVAGTGRGLDTARRAIEAHGGRIGLEPAPLNGTVAWFEIPDHS